MGKAAHRAAGGVTRTGLRSAWLECPRWDDQVARRKALEAFLGDVRVRQEGGQSWCAFLPGDEGEREVTGTSLERLLDRVARIVQGDAVREIAAEFPGWLVRVSGEWHWYASRTGPGAATRMPVALDAGSEACLRAKLAKDAALDAASP